MGDAETAAAPAYRLAAVTLDLRLREALRDAVRRRDRPAIRVLRSTVSALDNAGAVEVAAQADPTIAAVEVARRVVSTEEVERIVRSEIRELHEAAREFDSHGAAERGRELRADALLLERLVGDHPSG
jgi:hypothetical protein